MQSLKPKDIIWHRLNVNSIQKYGKTLHTEKESCDFIIHSRKGIFYIDTKECGSDVWYPKKAPAHQREDLMIAKNLGAISGFLLWFYKLDPTAGNLRFIEDFTKPARIDSGRKFDFAMILE